MSCRTSSLGRPLGSARLAAASLLGLLALMAAALATPAGAAAKTKLPCYQGFGLDSLRLQVKPRHCRQFVGNQPNHANEVDLKGIRWHTWAGGEATGSGWWISFATGGAESRAKVRLRAYKPVRYCGRYYSRLRVDWKVRQRHRHLTLMPPYPPGGCE